MLSIEEIERRLNQWIEAERTVKQRLVDEHGINPQAIDVQRALMDKRALSESADLLMEEWDADKLYREVSSEQFVDQTQSEVVTVFETLLPPDVPRLLTEETVRQRGEQWRIHRYDQDPFPFLPHAHNLASGVKMDLRNGRLYKGRTEVGKIRPKRLSDFRSRVKSVPLPPLSD